MEDEGTINPLASLGVPLILILTFERRIIMKRLFTIAISFLILMTGGIAAKAYTRESTEILDGEMIGKAYSGFYYTPKLEKVGRGAFAGCFYLGQFRTESAPERPAFNLRYICDYAFAGCENLTVLEVPTVTYFGDYSIIGCTRVQPLIFSKDITYIGEYAIGYTGTVNVDAKTKEVSVTDISQDPSMIMRVHAGTVSEAYAKENLFNSQYYDRSGVYVVGDFNANGEVSIDDCQDMLSSYVECLAGNKKPPTTFTVRNDLNNDNCSDISDVQMLLRYYTEAKTAGKNYTWFDLRKDMGMA